MSSEIVVERIRPAIRAKEACNIDPTLADKVRERRAVIHIDIKNFYKILRSMGVHYSPKGNFDTPLRADRFRIIFSPDVDTLIVYYVYYIGGWSESIVVLFLDPNQGDREAASHLDRKAAILAARTRRENK